MYNNNNNNSSNNNDNMYIYIYTYMYKPCGVGLFSADRRLETHGGIGTTATANNDDNNNDNHNDIKHT